MRKGWRRGAPGDRLAIEDLQDHTHHFTYGENLGQPDCPIPVEKFNWRPTRPPVIPELWDATCNLASERFSTVCTWQNAGKDTEFQGETYYWSKHLNFLSLLDLPFLSSKDDEDRSWIAHTERIPPLDTPVVVVLEPVLGKKQ